MLARSLIYIVDAYKFEAAVIGTLAAVALSCSLMSVSERVQATQQRSLAYVQPYPTYPKGKTTTAAPGVVGAVNAGAMGGSTTGALWPLKGMVTTEFGVPHRPWQDRHTGIDISTGSRSGAAAIGAFASGTVSKIVWSGSGYGNYIVVDHGNGISSLYAHLSSISVTTGQPVAAGQVIGREGSTGASTGTHLHFEILVNGRPVNPQQFIAGRP